MLRRALLCLLFALFLPWGARAQQITAEPPAPEYAALMTQVLAWERYYGKLLHLEEWTITVRFDTLPDGYLANTLSQPRIKTAITVMDPRRVQEETNPWRVVLHELLHIVTAQVHSFSFYLAPNEEAKTLVQYLFEDLVQRMAIWPVWPVPKGVKP